MLQVVVPGQFRGTATVPAGALVDPDSALRASINARAAWAPLKPAELALPPALAARSLGAGSSVESADPTSTASVFASADGKVRRDVGTHSYDREAAMDRLEKKGRADSKPICTGC